MRLLPEELVALRAVAGALGMTPEALARALILDAQRRVTEAAVALPGDPVPH